MANKFDLTASLKQVNEHLARVSIREKKGWLFLRARIPDPDGQLRRREISAHARADRHGVEIALARASTLDSALKLFHLGAPFSSPTWLVPPEPVRKVTAEKNIAHWIAEFERDYWGRYARTHTREETYSRLFAIPFRRLPPDASPSPEIFKEALLSRSEPDTRSRQIHHDAYRALAKFVGLPWTLESYRGNYKPSPKYVPSPEEVESAIDALGDRDRNWQFIEGTNQKLGRKLTPGLKNLGFPYTVYQLRHFYAVNTAVDRVSPVVASKLLGHSLQTHFHQYQNQMPQRDLIRSWREAREHLPDSSPDSFGNGDRT